jgi:hypothetical protein
MKINLPDSCSKQLPISSSLSEILFSFSINCSPCSVDAVLTKLPHSKDMRLAATLRLSATPLGKSATERAVFELITSVC